MSNQDRNQEPSREDRGGKVEKGAQTPPRPNAGIVNTARPKTPSTPPAPPDKK